MNTKRDYKLLIAGMENAGRALAERDREIAVLKRTCELMAEELACNEYPCGRGAITGDEYDTTTIAAHYRDQAEKEIPE